MPRDSQSHGQPMYIFPVLAPCIIKEVDNPRLLSRNNLLTPELQGSFNSPCSVVKKCIKCGRVCVCAAKTVTVSALRNPAGYFSREVHVSRLYGTRSMLPFQPLGCHDIAAMYGGEYP